MKFIDKNILLISPEPWGHIHVSKHHYAIKLAQRGNQVIFLNPPSNNFKLNKTNYENLKVCDYKGFWKGIRFYPKILRTFNQSKVLRSISQIANLKFDIIWSFDNSVFFDFDTIPTHIYKISHIVDYSQNFEFVRAAKSADICLAVTSSILKKQKQVNQSSYFINHGYSKEIPGKLKLPQSRSLKIGYAGNLEIPYIDWNLLKTVVKDNSECEFYFAGPGRMKIESKNCHFIGKLNKSQLTTFYNQMEILILCYKADEYPEQLANPHKIMEYLGTGKPIVSTYTKEYASIDFLHMSKSNQEWPDLLKAVIKDIHQHSSSELIRKRKAFAMNNTYDKQIERIEQIITKNG
ncbi:hypothetical protein [Ekhidna sp.]|jgi:hypothetical protein|uniref:hypothetical protein n=1 Tax=Ekhidna sp. TaxID=2608089 RepID=UPI0032EC3B16